MAHEVLHFPDPGTQLPCGLRGQPSALRASWEGSCLQGEGASLSRAPPKEASSVSSMHLGMPGFVCVCVLHWCWPASYNPFDPQKHPLRGRRLLLLSPTCSNHLLGILPSPGLPVWGLGQRWPPRPYLGRLNVSRECDPWLFAEHCNVVGDGVWFSRQS